MTDAELKTMIGEAVSAARASSALSRAEMSERMGMTLTYVSRLERGLAMPRRSTLFRVAQATGTKLKLQFVR